MINLNATSIGKQKNLRIVDNKRRNVSAPKLELVYRIVFRDTMFDYVLSFDAKLKPWTSGKNSLVPSLVSVFQYRASLVNTLSVSSFRMLSKKIASFIEAYNILVKSPEESVRGWCICVIIECENAVICWEQDDKNEWKHYFRVVASFITCYTL